MEKKNTTIINAIVDELLISCLNNSFISKRIKEFELDSFLRTFIVQEGQLTYPHNFIRFLM